MTPENTYCGYCSRLLDPEDANVLACVGCEGQFHLECTALSESPREQQHLKWKCNNCVKTEPPLKDMVEAIDYTTCDDLPGQVGQRLATLRRHFANEMQVVYARITSIQYERKDKDECLIINGVPVLASEKLIELVMQMGQPLGICLTPQQVFRSAPDSAKSTCSFVIKFDSAATRQLLLNTYLHSIMRPIVRPQWKLGADEAGDSLLPQTTTVASSISTGPLYMYEFLSPQNQTMLVQSVNSESKGATLETTDCVVVHDETSNVNIIPVIKISSAPLIRLASKESFDDFEGKL